jgi:CHAD domain-containing protein
MTVKLRKKEKLGRGLRRACCQHARKALACVNETHHAEAVHDARKEIKKLRALFRLMRAGLPKSTYRRAADAMRLAGKPLNDVRDARVTQKAFEELVNGEGRKFPEFK